MSAAKSSTIFALGCVLATALAAIISVYVFDYYEIRWGRGGSTQVLLFFAGVQALLAGAGFAFIASRLPVKCSAPVLFVCGVVFALAYIGVWVAGVEVGNLLAFVFHLGGGALLAFLLAHISASTGARAS